MGLDISHDAWHGAYSAFMRWRQMVAKIAGLPPLELMEGFYSDREDVYNPFYFAKKRCTETEFYAIKQIEEGLPIKWESLKPNPLHELLCHSDCDGYINYAACGKIADELEKLLPLFPEGEVGGHIGNWKEKTEQFIKGLRKAHSRKQKLQFH